VDKSLPSIPHHYERQTLPIDEAFALVEKAPESADRRAILALDAVATALLVRIAGIALRECPLLLPTIAERITNYQAWDVADGVMYRDALAGVAEARGWNVHWYNAKAVFDAARDVLQVDDLATNFQQIPSSSDLPRPKTINLLWQPSPSPRWSVVRGQRAPSASFRRAVTHNASLDPRRDGMRPGRAPSRPSHLERWSAVFLRRAGVRSRKKYASADESRPFGERA
jgi:hypothetical protein